LDRYGPLPEEVERLVSVGRLRLLCREYGLEEVAVAGTQIKISPMELPDSKQMRLKRLFPGGQYRPTSGVVQLPIPRTGGVGSDRVRDVALLQYIADFLLALDGKPQGMVDLAQQYSVNA